MGGEDKLRQRDDPEEKEEELEEEELVDPLDTLKEKCGQSSHCSGFAEKLQTCNDRVNSRRKTEETCTEELFDYLHCVNHCYQDTLLSKLK